MALRPTLKETAFRFCRLITAVSVRTKIMGIVLAPVLLLGLGITFQVRSTMDRTLRAELENRGISIARELAARSTDLLLTNDLFALYELIRDIVEHNEDVRYAFILDAGGQPVVHSFGRGFPTDLLRVNPISPDERYHVKILDTEEGLIYDIAVPIFEGRVGTARVGLSERQVQKKVAAITHRLLLITLGISMIGLALGSLLTWILTRPLGKLVRATQAVARGDLSSQTLPRADDEIGRLSLSFNQMVEELKRKEALRRQLLEKLITAQEEERRRISMELHDETGQALTSLLVGLTALENSRHLDEVKERVPELKVLVSQTLEAVHDLSVELRPRVLDDLGLVTALERYLHTCAAKYGLAVDFQTVGLEDRRLPPYIETTLYRIIQEAMTNVVRHAEATSVSILLERRDTSVVAIVEDDGCGFDLNTVRCPGKGTWHLGLYGMEERASLVGGKLTIESAPGRGTTVFVEIPLSAEEQEHGGED